MCNQRDIVKPCETHCVSELPWMIESYWLQTYVLAWAGQETTSFQHPVAHHETIYESTGIKFPQWLWGHVHWWNSCICRSWCKAPEDRNTSAIRKMCRQRKGTLEQKLNFLGFLIFLIIFLLFCCVFDLILISCRAVRWGSSQPRHCWHCPDFSALLSFLPAGCEYLNFITRF